MTVKRTAVCITAAGLVAVLVWVLGGIVVLAGHVSTLSSQVATARAEQVTAHPQPARPAPDSTALTTVEASTVKLVYICRCAGHCKNSQELEVFDGYGNPIFSVAAYGGAGMFGDNFSLFPPGTVYRGAGLTTVTDHGRYGWLVQSYESPANYATDHPGAPAGCTHPSLWIAPQGFWHCSARGRWVRGS